MAHPWIRKTALAAAAGLAVTSPLWAQHATTTPSLAEVTVSGKAAPTLEPERSDVGGFVTPLAQTPQSIAVLGADLLGANAIASLSQAIRLDASLADAYNTTGYVENLSVRGFLLNTDGNTLRNGLPVSTFAPLAIENKERIEVLKGVSGLQSGVSAPGGLVNLVSKMPVQGAFTTLALGVTERGGNKLQLDANTRVGAMGLRINLAQENLRPAMDHADGQRELVGVAVSLPVSPDTQLLAELEYHHKSQPSVPGLGLLDSNGDGVGDTLPAFVQPRLNLNNQSWSQPYVATSTLAQLRLQHRINPDWNFDAGWSAQRVRTDDRLAFPDGCSNAPTYVYPGLCANGDVDVYDFRSEGEQRFVRSWNAQLQGKVVWGLPQQLRLGMSGRESNTDLAPTQAYNWVGTTNIYQPIPLPGDASANELNADSQEQTTEAHASVVTQWSPSLRSFVGVRASRLQRSSAKSDGSEAVSLSETVSTPWLGLAWTAAPGVVGYVSWGQGVELDVVPNRPTKFSNAGQVLPANKSEQTEVGVKWQASARLLLTAAAFTIDKPFADDRDNGNGTSTRVGGAKTARHSGVELMAAGAVNSQLSLQASLAWLDARWAAAALSPALVDKPVTNVPKTKASLFADYKMASLPGLSMHGLLLAEGEKSATADGRTVLPASWQVDAGVNYRQRAWGQSLVWGLQIENLTDRSYWREAPTTYWGGEYLFASTPRTVRASVTLEF